MHRILGLVTAAVLSFGAPGAGWAQTPLPVAPQPAAPATGAPVPLKVTSAVQDGDWLIRTYANAATGVFSYCHAFYAQEEGRAVGIGLFYDYRLFMRVHSPLWSWSPTARADFTLKIDGVDSLTGKAGAVDKTILNVNFPNDGGLQAKFRNGKSLEISVGKDSIQYSLAGIDRILPRLNECVRTQMNPGQPGVAANQAPAAGTQAPAAPSAKVAPAPAAAPAPGGIIQNRQTSAFNEGNWQGGSFVNSANGAFNYCLASNHLSPDSILTIAYLSDFRWWLRLTDAAWNWSQGQRVAFTMSIDGKPSLSGIALALNKNVLDLSMPVDLALQNGVRQGRGLEVTIEKKNFDYSLTGSDRVMTQLEDCVRSQRAIEQRNIAAGAVPAPKPEAANAAPSPGVRPLAPAEPQKPGTVVATAPPAKAEPAKPEPPKPAPSKSSAGSGILVTAAGHVVTNAHVAKDCKPMTVRRPGEAAVPASLLALDERDDLALIKVGRIFDEADVGRISTRAALAGEKIAVYGFPLPQALSADGNFVAGNVSALAGVGNDINLLQISVPVQPGNSGGPLINIKGSVLGVVSSRLNEKTIASATGSVPQNANFAIKANVLASFLDANAIIYGVPESETEMDLPSLAERAKRFTVQVLCNV